MELLDFLRARLDEDEAVALAAGKVTGGDNPDAVSVIHAATAEQEAVAEHMARHDPERVLREVEAKRRMIALHQEKREQGYGSDFCAECGFGEVSQSYYPCATLRLLALPYADHPDYRQEWKP